ncbi:MAG: 30S ribosomal protein S14 [Pseudobacteriovorax sp.]|nr:30S ribosomal protein S14 [Pseudobacteriovorax sp.]
MAKKSKIASDNRKRQIVERYRSQRDELRARSKNPHLSEDERAEARAKLAKLPRNSCPTRLKNRCMKTGRARGNLRKFGLSRIAFREMALAGELPGVKKASW